MTSLPLPSAQALHGDPKRQAVATIEAYDYQIWSALEQWLKLGLDEVLYLEGAEDFDVCGPVQSQASQVKHSPTNISLASKDVQDAIHNYWKLVQDNPNVPGLKLRFLTQGGWSDFCAGVTGPPCNCPVRLGTTGIAGACERNSLVVLLALRRLGAARPRNTHSPRPVFFRCRRCAGSPVYCTELRGEHLHRQRPRANGRGPMAEQRARPGPSCARRDDSFVYAGRRLQFTPF